MKYKLEPDNRDCPDKVLLDDLRAVAARLGRTSITKDEYNANGRFSAATIQNRFGSWNDALSKSNLTVKKRNRIPHGELLDDLKQVAERLGTKSISVKAYTGKGRFSAPTISKAFGSWTKALVAAGLEVSSSYHPKADDIDLLSNLATVWETLGRQPKQGDLHRSLSRFSADTYKRRFGSWRKTLEFFVENANDSNPPKDGAAPVVITDSVVLPQSQKHRTQRIPSWRLRFLVNRRDRFRCCACGRSPTNELGVVLHVDHIVPWSKGGETVIDNLQTLCEKCNLGKSNLSMNGNEG